MTTDVSRDFMIDARLVGRIRVVRLLALSAALLFCAMTLPLDSSRQTRAVTTTKES